MVKTFVTLIMVKSPTPPYTLHRTLLPSPLLPSLPPHPHRAWLQVPHFKGDRKSPELDALVDDAHQRYMAGLQALWEEHKGTYARGRRRSLRIVE